MCVGGVKVGVRSSLHELLRTSSCDQAETEQSADGEEDEGQDKCNPGHNIVTIMYNVILYLYCDTYFYL